jgi:hypothetical protein
VENRETKRDFLRTLFCTIKREREREREREEVLSPIMAILGFFVVSATAEAFTGDGLLRFFLITVTKLPPEEFSPVTMDDSGRIFLAGAVTAAAPGLPIVAQTASFYDFVIALVAAADDAASRCIDGIGEGVCC